MEQSSLGKDETDFSLKEWALKAKISRTNTSSRRFSESNLRSFRENAMSFRSNIAISSTASSPGYTLKGEIDPSTYSFTTALKALQAKTVYTWEHVSPDGYTLNSKWNDAEKYICNPLSGQVPMECLSAKTLSGRSFRSSVTSRITMSAPLIYPDLTVNSPISEHQTEILVTSQEKRRNTTRDVGTQSTPVDIISSSSPSPAQTPSIEERPMKMISEVADCSSISSEILKSETEVEVKETGERKKQVMMCWCSYTQGQGGCLSLIRGLWMRTIRQRDKHKHNKHNTQLACCPPSSSSS